MARLGMVINLDKCTGCRACMVACKVENNTPQGSFWMHVFRFEEDEYPRTKTWFMPRPCMHCDNAPCVKVCPVGARFKQENGLVATDSDRCIGCRYCEVACPYGVNNFNWQDPTKGQYLDWRGPEAQKATQGASPPYANPDLQAGYGKGKRKIAGGGHSKGVIEKCTFCPQLVEMGKLPACADECPTFAIQFGDLDDLMSDVSRTLQNNENFRLLEEAGTKPRVYYVGGTPPNSKVREIEKVDAKIKGRA